MNPVYLYYPNVVDYIRGIVLLFSFSKQLFNEPTMFTYLYTFAYFLDAIDGLLARTFNQNSHLGAGLDMVLDRSSTCALFAILLQRYPDVPYIWLTLLSLDISSHYLHMLATTSGSHKTTTPQSHGYLLHYYYSSKIILATVCGVHELSMLTLYNLSFEQAGSFHSLVFNCIAGQYGSIYQLLLCVSLPIGIYKNILSILQMQIAIQHLAAKNNLPSKSK